MRTHRGRSGQIRSSRGRIPLASVGGGGGGNPGIDAWVDSGAVSTRGGGVDDFTTPPAEATDGRLVAPGYDRTFVSTDGGATFTEYTNTGTYYQIAYSPIANRFVCWRQSTGLWYSSDGITWTQSNVTSGISGDVKYVPFLGEFIGIRFNGQPRYSADGITWGAEVASSFIRNTERAFIGPNEMIFSGSSADFNRRSVGKLSTDFTTMTGLAFSFHAQWCGSFGWRAFPATGTTQLLYSSTNAASWSSLGPVLPSNQSWEGIAFDSNLERLWIIGNNGALHYSDDGGSTWSANVASGVSPTFVNGPYAEYNHMEFLPGHGSLWAGTDKLVHSP